MKYVPTGMINTTQAKMLGFKDFKAIEKGWMKRTYELTPEQLELFKALNGVKGEKRQLIVVNEHKPAEIKEGTVTVKYKGIGELHNLIDILYNSDYDYEVN